MPAPSRKPPTETAHFLQVRSKGEDIGGMGGGDTQIPDGSGHKTGAGNQAVNACADQRVEVLVSRGNVSQEVG